MLDYNFFHAIAIKDGGISLITNLLQLKHIVNIDDENNIASNLYSDTSKVDYENFLLAKSRLDYTYIICPRFYDFKYTINVCDVLSQKYPELYSLAIDVHTGLYRFIKIYQGAIVRFFERDANHNTGEFGTPIQEELIIKTESKKHDYFHVVQIAEKLFGHSPLEFNDVEKVILGKRHLVDIEKYPENIPYLKKNPEQANTPDERELPF